MKLYLGEIDLIFQNCKIGMEFCQAFAVAGVLRRRFWKRLAGLTSRYQVAARELARI
jgi:hypothetical protein